MVYIPDGAEGLRGVGGGGREGLGGLAGLKPPFAINGQSLPLATLLSLDTEASVFSEPCALLLENKQNKNPHRDPKAAAVQSAS